MRGHKEQLNCGEVKSQTFIPFTGRWRIVSMSTWDESFLDEEEDGYLDFDQKTSDQFHFAYVHGQMDCRLTTRNGEAAVEWTWDGLKRTPFSDHRARW